MKVIGSNILVVPINEESKTSIGLLMSASDAKELRYKKATVVAVGDMADSVRPGNFIYFDKAAGHSIRVNDDMYTVIRLQDVVVVL